MRRLRNKFQLIDPLNPPSPDGEFGQLASIVVESATWFFTDPSDTSPNAAPSGRPRSQSEINEAIDAAHLLLKGPKHGTDSIKGTANMGRDDHGWALVDLFCDRFVANQPAYHLTLRTGRTIGQRQLLCAFALLYVERTALAIRERRPADVCNLMRNILELICEVRRALDREAGSDVAARRVRQRWQKMYELRARACKVFDEGKWRSPRQAAQVIHPKLDEWADAIGAPKLSVDRRFQTVYEWLLAHKKRTSA